MLSPEHVRVRRQGKELKLLALGGELRARAVALAEIVTAAAQQGIGESRDELHAAWAQITVAPRERKILQGLEKLVEESAEFEQPEGGEAAETRTAVFLAAQAARKIGDFERGRLLGDVAAARGVDVPALEAALYADLRGAHRLIRCDAPAPEVLVERYEHAQVQAILLRAVRVICNVRCSNASRYRELFHKLKFRRLMHRITALPEGGYRLEIDGPFSLFQSVSKYGMELSLMLPVLESCDELDLVADVRWTERSGVLEFRHRAGGREAPAVAALLDDMKGLAEALSAPDTGWSARPADRILNLPGLGVCVPDLALTRTRDGAEVLVEVLGYWSRASVWKRVEFAERGLGAKVLFAVNAKLRVSEDVLDDDAGACLYVYKNRIVPSSLLRRAEGLLSW